MHQGRSRTPPASMSAASRGRCRGSSRGCCGRLCGTRRAGHGPRGPLGPVGCGGGRGAPPCASHRPISTLERPSPAPWAAPEACLGIRKCDGCKWPLVGLWTSGRGSSPRRFGARDGRAGAQTAPNLAAGWVGGSGRQRLCEVIYGWPHPTHAAQVVVVGLHASGGPWGSLGWAGAGWFSSQSAPWG